MICAIACKSLSSSMPLSLLFFTIIAVLRGLSMRVRCAARIEIEKQSISRRNQLLFWYVGSLQAKTRQWHVFSQQSPFPRGRRLRRAIGKAQNKTPQDKSCGVLVRRKGLEPPTYWFVASHSIQLSYRRIPRSHQRSSIIAHALGNCKPFLRKISDFFFDVPDGRTKSCLSASCSKMAAEVCRIWRAEFF